MIAPIQMKPGQSLFAYELVRRGARPALAIRIAMTAPFTVGPTPSDPDARPGRDLAEDIQTRIGDVAVRIIAADTTWLSS